MYDSRLIWREPVSTHAISCIGGFGELGELGLYVVTPGVFRSFYC